MKREKFALLVLLVEIVAITILHSSKKDGLRTPNTASVQQQPASVASSSWNSTFSLIRIK